MVKVTVLIRQKAVFLSWMKNWDNVKKSVESATNSIGSADIENQKYLDSISGKLSNLERSIEQLSSTVINSEIIKFFIDLGITGVKAVDGLVSALTPLGTIGATLGGIFGAKTSLDYGKTYNNASMQGSGKSYCYGQPTIGKQERVYREYKQEGFGFVNALYNHV